MIFILRNYQMIIFLLVSFYNKKKKKRNAKVYLKGLSDGVSENHHYDLDAYIHFGMFGIKSHPTRLYHDK